MHPSLPPNEGAAQPGGFPKAVQAAPKYKELKAAWGACKEHSKPEVSAADMKLEEALAAIQDSESKEEYQ